MLTNNLRANLLGINSFAFRTFAFRLPQEPIPKWHVYKNDMVEIISGRYKKT